MTALPTLFRKLDPEQTTLSEFFQLLAKHEPDIDTIRMSKSGDAWFVSIHGGRSTYSPIKATDFRGEDFVGAVTAAIQAGPKPLEGEILDAEDEDFDFDV